MKRILSILMVFAVVVLAGCEDSPSDPTGQPIVGTWKASKIGDAFAGSASMDVEFTSSGSFSMDLGSTTWTGSYSTSGSASSSTVRDITITASSPASKTFTGIYTISGSQLKLEVVPMPLPAGVTAPEAAEGIGSVTVNGSQSNAYVSELQKQ